MRKSAGIGFALSHVSGFRLIGRAAGAAACAALFGALATLGGCADSPNSPYPSLSKITGVEDILTPEERQKAVQDLEKQDPSRSQNAAAKDIQK